MQRPIGSLVAALALTWPAAAQDIVASAQSGPRMATRLAFWAKDYSKALGQVCIQYAQPTWKEEYETSLTHAKGASMRLGSDFWTTLDTNVELTLGGTRVAIGLWYLGLRRSEKDEWTLLL